MFSSPTQCLLDGKPVKGFKGLSVYLTKRGISHKEYYDQFFKKEGEGVCYICKKEAKFTRISEGYRRLCSNPECTSKARASYDIESIAARNNITLEEAQKILADRTARHTESWQKTIKEKSESDPNYMKRMTGYSKDSYIARGYSEEEADRKAKEIGKKVSSSQIEWNKNSANKELIKKTRWNNVQYWIEKGMSHEEAVAEIAKRQVRDLAFFQKKYGMEEGKKHWMSKIEKWSQNFQKRCWSQASQNLFSRLYEFLTDEDKHTVRFATLNPETGEIKDVKRNFETRLFLGDRIVLPDFIIGNKIIEFDGVYWHGKNKIDSGKTDREKKRDELLIKNGFDVLHINELDWYKNPEEVINKCKAFIYNSK